MGFKYLAAIAIICIIAISIVITGMTRKEIPKRENTEPKTVISPTLPVEESPKLDTRKVSRGEKECRRVLERIYNVSFPSVWPEWLKSTETNRKLELDCFAEIPLHVVGIKGTGVVAIACEYQGQQHYRYTPSMQSMTQYDSQIWNDEYKRKMCQLHGVHLIEVPYTVHFTEISEYVHTQLKALGLLPV